MYIYLLDIQKIYRKHCMHMSCNIKIPWIKIVVQNDWKKVLSSNPQVGSSSLEATALFLVPVTSYDLILVILCNTAFFGQQRRQCSLTLGQHRHSGFVISSRFWLCQCYPELEELWPSSIMFLVFVFDIFYRNGWCIRFRLNPFVKN